MVNMTFIGQRAPDIQRKMQSVEGASECLCRKVLKLPSKILMSGTRYFSTVIASICYLEIFEDHHADKCEVTTPCGFDLHFSISNVEHFFFSCAC